MHGYAYANNNPLTHSDPAGTEIGSRPNSCQYSLANCSKKTQKEVGYDAKSGTTDYRRGNIYKRSQAAKKHWVAANTPVSNDIDHIADDYWHPRMNGEFTDDFWYNPVYENSQKGQEGTACFGREGCRQAFLYVLHGGKDVEKAKEIAATYCVYHAEECNEKAAAVARGNVVKEVVYTGLLAYLGGAAGRGAPCNSFAPDTQVLMADGTTKAIEDVRTGDKVLSTDPRTGRTEVKTVTAEIIGEGRKNLVRVTLAIEVDGKKQTATITATAGHPFWVPALGTWTDATDLTAGEQLRTATGSLVRITEVRRWTQSATVHNLTVADFHTYHVLAGATPVLVHNSNANCNSLTRSQADDVAQFLGYTKTNKRSAGGAAIWEHKKAAGGQPRYITYDRTGHNKEAIFKGASFKNPFQSTKDSARDGTYGLDISPSGVVQGLKKVAK